MRTGKRIVKILLKVIAVLIVLVLFGISLFYINTTIYKFPDPSPFSGNEIYNPYENLPETSYRANFHAHSVAWKNVTNGHNTEKDIFDAYTEHGYDIPGISNYHKISRYAEDKTDLYIPEYEHGYNIFKSHCLAISPDEVSKFDYPLWQLTSHKQKIIENIKANNGYVAMAHPKFAGGRTFSDMESLVHYDFTEVLNHYRNSEEYWDKALSAGRLTWIMGNDDTHDIVKEPTFRIWNIIYSKERNPDSVLHNMQLGHNYAVNSYNTKWDNKLKSLRMIQSDAFIVEMDTIADSIQFIGQDGKNLKTIAHTSHGAYKFNTEDTYVRVVAYNKNSQVYLNPLIRYDGKNVPLNTFVKPEPRMVLTWLSRLIFVLISMSLLLLLRKIIRA